MTKRKVGWQRLGEYIVYRPQWRKDRNSWSIRIRNVITNRIQKFRVDLPLPRSALPKASRQAEEKGLEIVKGFLALKERFEREITFEEAVEQFLEVKKEELRKKSWED